MKVFLFKPEFARKVEAGEKFQTVRQARKYPAKPGEMLSLREWSGRPYASKQRVLCERECEQVTALEIWEDGTVILGGATFYPGEVQWFAEADGFKDSAAMVEFFRNEYGLPQMNLEVTFWK